jgi:transposase
LPTLIAEPPELGRLDRRNIASLVGVCSHQSRQRRVARPKDNRRRARPGEDRPLHGGGGRKPLNPVIAAHSQKLRAAGKAAKQALTACIRKLLVILNAILRERKPWSFHA